MSDIRSEISEKNKYYIPKERYYELLHFCRQYNDWVKEINSINLLSDYSVKSGSNELYSLTEDRAIKLAEYNSKVSVIEGCLFKLDPAISNYIFLSVCNNRTYEYLRCKLNIPCCRNVFYKEYRRFFWLLDKARK